MPRVGDSPLYTSIKVPALSPRHCVDLGFSAFALAVMDPLQFPRNLVGSASSATTSSTGVARRTTHNNRVCTHAQLLPTMVYPSPQPGFLSSTIAGTRNSANGRVTRQRHLAQKTAVKWRRWKSKTHTTVPRPLANNQVPQNCVKKRNDDDTF